MSEIFSFRLSFPGVKFDDFLALGTKCPNTFQAQLETGLDNIDLKIFYPEGTLFGEKLIRWTHTLDYSKFGNTISLERVYENDRVQKIDLSNSKLTGFRISSAQRQNGLVYVLIKLDSVKIYWSPPHSLVNTAEFYLGENSLQVVAPFYTVVYGHEEKYQMKRMQGKTAFYKFGKIKFRPEFSTYVTDERNTLEAKITKEPKIQFTFKETLSEEDLVHYGEMICALASFYYHSKITYQFIRIRLPENTITIKKVQPKSQKETFGSLRNFGNHWNFHDFLSAPWKKQLASNHKMITKVIGLFNQALLVEDNSEFLIRYNILEICDTQKESTQNFKFTVNKSHKRKVFKQAFETLLAIIDESERDAFQKKWTTMLGKLEKKPMKSSLVSFLESQGLDVSSFPIPVEKLKSMRDNITHGSLDKIKSDEIQMANTLLYRINGILILNLLGIKNWKLDTSII